ncbi:MAG: methylmalonyl Co-A mutase-associated GTPase MeaB [Candidatus Tyrphobacter sp.]
MHARRVRGLLEQVRSGGSRNLRTPVTQAGSAELIRRFRAGEPRALARAITFCESGIGAQVVAAVHERAGNARTVGITGPPGVGKSTLGAALARTARGYEKSVGVISVDPSSPFSHGALLGDRIRLAEHFTDRGVFIRSMATRGHFGGLAGATADAALLMDAFGLEFVIIETVGAGQNEVEIASLAQTTVVALQPGSGDSVQILKAGIMEIADVFVVNKSDHPMADLLRREIRSMLQMAGHAGWVAPIVATQAVRGDGIDELWAALERHALYLKESGEFERRRRARFAHQVRAIAAGRIERLVEGVVASDGATDGDPYAAAERAVRSLGIRE